MPPPPVVPPPPHPTVEIRISKKTILADVNQLRCFLRTVKKRSKASAVPSVGQKSFLSFFALVGAVVVTVRVEVWVAVPLMITLSGFRLQEGISLTLVIDVATAQLRLIVPENPFVPATLIVPVLPEVAPGATEMLVVPPLPTVKLG